MRPSVQARAGFLEIYRFLRDEAGFGPDEVNTFLSSGMLFSVLLGIELPALYGRDPGATELMEATFGAKCQAVLAAMDHAPE
jgi:TetR/AcrR family transcriptional regulator